MKLFKTLSCLLILSLGFASYSEAKGRSFGGGFRSQRMAPAPRAQRAPQPQAAPATQAAPSAQSTQPRSMFGSFGRAKPAAAGAPQTAQPLNMSKDLNTNAAQGNALKANDARTTTGTTAAGAAGVAGAATAGTSNSGWFRSGNPSAAKAAPVQSGAQPTVMQQRGGGFLNNAMWFMLGSSLARSHQPAPSQNTQNENHQGSAAVSPTNEHSSGNVDGQVVDPLAGMSPPVEEKESFFMSFLRFTLWAAIIFGLYRLVTTIMRAKKISANKKPNYTFGN